MKRSSYTGTILSLALVGSAALAPRAQAQDTCQEIDTWQELAYGLDWLIRAFDPSDENRFPGIAPAAQLATWPRDRATEKRIVLFGDLLPMQKDTPARAHAELRALFASADLIIGNVESFIYQKKTWWSDHALDLEADQSGNFHASTGFLKSFMDQYCMRPSKTVINVANNHAGDHGRPGWDETVRASALLGLRGVVGQRNASGGPALGSYDLGNGLKVGVVGWTQEENCPLDNAWARLSDVNGVSWPSVKQAQGIDLLIGSVHWGEQFYFFPAPATRQQAGQLTAANFDLIAGHGPSVLQPAERFNADLVFYSLGNVNANYSLNGSTQFVPVTELLVDTQGRIVEYRVHPFAQRKVASSLPSIIYCPDGRIVTDQARDTDWEVVPLREVSNFWGVRSALEADFKLVFPH